ncbi:MAG: nuclear transport factor 2 family protein [Gammaproteobacteria bacterium]
MSVSPDEASIVTLIRTYFDSMFESSKNKVDAAFHPNAVIAGIFDGKFVEMSREEFGQFVERSQPSAKENGDIARLDIISIDIAGNTAVALVRDDYLGSTFLDTLSLIKLHDQWSIYNKLFHIEGVA